MRNRKIYLILIIPAILIVTAFSGSDFYLKLAKSIDIFGRVYKEIAVNYVDDIHPEELMIAGIKGMLESLDPYTIYISEDMQKDFDVLTKGKYGGIGASVGIRNDKITIVDVLEGYSAQRQGLKIGDVIVKIDDTIIDKKNYSELGKYMKGKPGSQVHVYIKRLGHSEILEFDLVREEIKVSNISYYGFVPEGSGNVYIKLSSFSTLAGNELKKALIELKKKHEIESIVLDLRGNPGGLLEAAIDVSQKFIPKGKLIVTVKGRGESKIQEYFSKQAPLAGKSRLAVLIDGGSASASEIVAGAIQDHDRGVIIGTKSFGKGLVQSVLPITRNSSLKITTAKYYTPSGRCIQKIDYSDGSKVIEEHLLESKEFLTENHRSVFSAGGINPDSTVPGYFENEFISSLLARGMFFRFATEYVIDGKKINFDSLDDDVLLQKFKNFLKKEEYNFTASEIKLIDELTEKVEQKNYEENILAKIHALKNNFVAKYIHSVDDNRTDVIAEIKKEIAARISGRAGRVKEALKHDPQFNTAVSVLSNSRAYHNLLGFEN